MISWTFESGEWVARRDGLMGRGVTPAKAKMELTLAEIRDIARRMKNAS